MRILVTNDDGITAEGIIRLAAMAKKLGDVTVIAPDSQCSAMSQKLTILTYVDVKKVRDFPVEGVEAYTVSGTPADCVRLGIDRIMKERPDIVFSGINNGYNTGYDIAYSGTIGATMEALFAGIPAIAFSTDYRGIFDTVDEYLQQVTEEVLKKPIGCDEIWKLNFPGCPVADCRGILWDRTIAQDDFYNNIYTEQPASFVDGAVRYAITVEAIERAYEGTDIKAILDNYISIGKVKSTVVTPTLQDKITYRGRLKNKPV